MKKYLIIITIIIFGLNYQNVLGACEYQSEIDQCVSANLSKGAKEITDFVCAETNSTEEIAYQVIFDKKLKIIDKEAENFLKTLQDSIQYYYGPESKESYLDGINYINELFTTNGTLWNKYNKFCQPGKDNSTSGSDISIISDYMQCIDGDSTTKKASANKASAYFGQSLCKELVEFKLYVYKKIAYNLLQANKLDFLKDFRKKQLKSTREKYDDIIGSMYSNLDHIIRITNQRDKVTPQCQNIGPSS